MIDPAAARVDPAASAPSLRVVQAPNDVGFVIEVTGDDGETNLVYPPDGGPAGWPTFNTAAQQMGRVRDEAVAAAVEEIPPAVPADRPPLNGSPTPPWAGQCVCGETGDHAGGCDGSHPEPEPDPESWWKGKGPLSW